MSNNSRWIQHSFRLLQHESKRGELTIVFFAIVLAVAVVFSLTGFATYINNGLAQSSSKFIAADKVLQSDRQVDAVIMTKSAELGLEQAQTVQTNSMIFAGDKMQLSTIKAVSASYPLRGQLLVKHLPTGQARANKQPKRGTVWLEPQLLSKLAIDIGDLVEIGVSRFTVTGIIDAMPDTSFRIFTSGPTAIINQDDLPATQLVQPASRVRYKYLFAGSKEALAQFSNWLSPHLNESQRWYDVKSSQSPLARALNRAEKYLSLASMLGVILAAVAVSVATRRYSERNQPIVATLKALGASITHIKKLYLLHWGLLTTISISAGLLLGYLLMLLGVKVIAEQFSIEAGYLSFYPFVVALITGVVCALAFAISPFSQLFGISALTVIRGERMESTNNFYVSGLAKLLPPLIALFALLVLFSQDLLLSVALLVGGAFICLVLALLGNVFIQAGRSLGSKAGSVWHLAIANLKRRAKQNVVQLISFTIAIKLLLLILVMKNSLMQDWQAQLPENAANRFLINIAKHELAQVQQFINEFSIQSSDLYPVVRGRLSAVNDEQVVGKVANNANEGVVQGDSGGAGRRGFGRELNLTWRARLPKNNVLVSGKWWSANTDDYLVSVESGVAKRMNLALGDSLTFALGGQQFSAQISSIREVDWQSFQPNFFMIFNPVVLQNFPATYIASMHISPNQEQGLQQLLSQHPTISTINVDAILTKLREVIEQVTIAIGFILVLVLIAGSLVLVAQVQASMEEREREIAILRTLGAKGALLKQSVLCEFLALGAIAGILASIAMESAVYLLQVHIFEISPSWHWPYWLLGASSGAVFVGLVGYFACHRLVNLSAVTLIRRTL